MKTLVIMMFVSLFATLSEANDSNNDLPLTDPHQLVEKVLLPNLRSSLVNQSKQWQSKAPAPTQRTVKVGQKAPKKATKTNKRPLIRSGLLSAAD